MEIEYENKKGKYKIDIDYKKKRNFITTKNLV